MGSNEFCPTPRDDTRRRTRKKGTDLSLSLHACLRVVPPCGTKAGERVGVRVKRFIR